MTSAGGVTLNGEANLTFSSNNLNVNGLIIGNQAYAASAAYIGMKTSNQSGTNDYMIISGTSDGNTYVSAKDNANVLIRGGGNNSSNQIEVVDGSTITATTSTFTVTGTITENSDRKLKENIIQIGSALSIVEQLRGVYYNRIDQEDKSRKIGFIAQEIQEILPEVITKNDEDILSVSYGKMVALLTEAIKELSQQNKELIERVNKLENKLN
jgi:hypothetical protein